MIALFPSYPPFGVEVSELDPTLSKVLEAYKAAVYAKDVEAFIRLYDPNARVFDAWGIWSYEGTARWQGAVDGWLSSLGTERVKVSFEDLSAVVTPALAYVSAIVTYTGVSAEGEQLRAMHNRISWVLKTSGHVLRIIHEHTSAPIGFEDSKAILQRPGQA